MSDRNRPLADMGDVARRALLHRPWRSDQFPLCRAARIQPSARCFAPKGSTKFSGGLFGFILLYPRDFDQIQHFAHHRYTQIWEKDGELARDRYTLTSYLLWVLGPTYWYTRVRRILRFSLGDRDGALYSGRPQSRRHPRGALAPCGLRGHRCPFGRGGKRDGPETVASADAHDEARASAAKHHRASRPAACRRDHREHPLDPHQRADALDVLEHAVPYRPSRFSRRALLCAAASA